MYITELFEDFKPVDLKQQINAFLSKLDSDYQYVDIKFSSAGDGNKTWMSALIVMRYVPKRKVLFEKNHV